MADTVFITGASRGLGYHLCVACLARGDKVLAGVRSPDSKSIAALKAANSHALTVVQLDVGSDSSVEDACRVVSGRVSAIDICINNAGIYPPGGGTLETCDFANAADMYNVNALGPLRIAKFFQSLITKGSRPVLANISSEAGCIEDNPRDKEFEYCMSKAALNQATALLARKFRSVPARVLALNPGWIRTDMGGPDASGDPAQAAAGILEVIAAQRDRIGDHLFFDWKGEKLGW